jgi:hypothetical protein
MPGLLAEEGARRLDARVDGTRLADQQARLIGDNLYVSPDDLEGAGRRPALDDGELGVIGIGVENAAQAAERPYGAQGPAVTTARWVDVTTGGAQLPATVGGAEAEIPVAVGGEVLSLRTPVVCSVRPRALRVLLPHDRPAYRHRPPRSTGGDCSPSRAVLPSAQHQARAVPEPQHRPCSPQ